ncbi:methyltransferase domain-containing protein [Actinocrispum wychmicini]|uniref:Ubiquinone/menaquinone biosynthesis C-methylase UbiE n=1 Tax=Actinocrispum wychmicini TaxID=1213861 RepID=A0A4V2S616_9PSEU|nr:methyltransferase domain-containing protein [Actinocrispum wychmicini]TCO54310.1 ubiquinone/menaquinone biosynthesis C-methylase UbiE [Actinocrispum wychmicini]
MSDVDQPVSFQAPKGVSNDADLQRLTMALDVQAKLLSVRRLRSWAHDALAPRPGHRAVDVGAGTGEELQVLAISVGPSGDAIGIEPNAGLRAEAERRAEAAGSTARFVDGDAYALPFENSSVDLVRCERVWQHLAEPERAAAEIFRVLRPGGRAVVIDTDWATTILHPGDPAVVDAMVQSWLNGHPNPFSGRRLAGLLTAAGLAVADIGSQAQIHDAGLIEMVRKSMGAGAVEAGVITEQQLDQLLTDLYAGADRGDFHSSVTMFAPVAHKTGD